jgi:hypothetical protein
MANGSSDQNKKPKSRERQPLFSRKVNTNFFNADGGVGGQDVEIFESKPNLAK